MEIIIMAVEASEPIEGMISVGMGKPPISRFAGPQKLAEIINAVDCEHTRLKAAGINHQVRAICYGKKPRGWNQARNLLQRDFIA